MICSIMKIFSLFIVLIFSSCGVSQTKHLFVEVRVNKSAPDVKRLSKVGYYGMSSGPARPKPDRNDENYVYYEYSALIQDRKKCMLVIDFEALPNGVEYSDIYDLKKHGLSLRSQWSSWIEPNAAVKPTHVLGSSFQALHTKNAPQQDSPGVSKASQIRYRIELWDLE